MRMFSGLMSRVAGRLQRLGDLPHDMQCDAQVRRSLALQVLSQIDPLNVLLRDVVRPLGLADGVNLHDVGMIQPAGGAGLLRESLEVEFVGDELAPQNLERHVPRHRALLGQVHFRHAAAPQAPQQPEISQSPISQIVESRRIRFGIPPGIGSRAGVGGFGVGVGVGGRHGNL